MLSATNKPKLKISIVIPGKEVKNGQEIRARLSPKTAAMLAHYIKVYRPIHCATSTPWLFPRQNGTHWPPTQACGDFKDTIARFVGADASPRLMRCLAGKIYLEARPGAIAHVQQMRDTRASKRPGAFTHDSIRS